MEGRFIRLKAVILKECILIDNDVYKSGVAITGGQPEGIVVHSTGCNNPNLCRYVNPVPSQSYYDEVIADVGKNPYGNSWNRPGVGACVHAMIGLNASGVVETYQTLPWTMCCGGVWKGKLLKSGARCYSDKYKSKIVCYTNEDNMLSNSVYNTLASYGIAQWTYNGQTVYIDTSNLASYNSNPTARIQFETLEDNLANEEYFYKVMREGQEFCAYICKMYNLPVSKISSHKESFEAGYGSQHGDPENWLNKFGKNMDWYRSEVQKILDGNPPSPTPTPTPTPTFKLGDEVKIKDGVTTWANKATMSSWVPSYVPYYVRAINGNKITISTMTSGAITGTVFDTDLVLLNPKDDFTRDFEVGDAVRIRNGVTTWANGAKMQSWVPGYTPYYVRSVRDTTVVISTQLTGDITGTIRKVDVLFLNQPDPEPEPEPEPEPTPDPEPQPEPEPQPQPEPQPIPDPDDTTSDFEVGEAVCIKQGAKFASGEDVTGALLQWSPYFISKIDNGVATITVYLNGETSFQINTEYLEKVVLVDDTLKIGDIVSINPGATTYNGSSISWRGKIRQWIVKSISENKVVLGKSVDGRTLLDGCEMNIKDVTEVHPELMKVTSANSINVRDSASIFGRIVGAVNSGDYVIGYGKSIIWVNIGDTEWVCIIFVESVK